MRPKVTARSQASKLEEMVILRRTEMDKIYTRSEIKFVQPNSVYGVPSSTWRTQEVLFGFHLGKKKPKGSEELGETKKGN